jgi:hypothetical protein
MKQIDKKINIIADFLELKTRETSYLKEELKDFYSQTRKECYDEMREIVKSKKIEEIEVFGEDISRGQLEWCTREFNKILDNILKQLDEKEGK